ncbi:hypothetical protein LAZ67_8001367 [Cordylochernes scorpioides]|uniref:Uncharacterized protein n=1 Tax=Cordylochernes scorpioides TaxID=51811 RepID=A0ABY6KQN0_9ARAC|nr:hypothetical protein LAZ67_8001367 [Cordylochernes scorpioides]
MGRPAGASSSAGAVVTADASANRAQNWTEASEADENGFIQPRRKRKRGGASTPDSRLPRATATCEKSSQRKTPQVPKKKSGATEIRSSRQQQVQCKARTETATFEQCCFIEHCADFGPLD